MRIYPLSLIGLLIWASVVPARAETRMIGEETRSDLSVTLYSNGLALIRDRRKGELSKGNNELEFSSVAPMMLPETAQVVSDGAFQPFEQSLLPANMSYRELLAAHLGKTIKIIRTHPTTGAEAEREGMVLAVEPDLIVRIGERIETVMPGRVVFSELPRGMRSEPVFHVLGKAAAKSAPALGLHYLTHGFSWQADHVATYKAEAKRLHLQSRATLVNKSGLDLKAAHMQLMAGQVRQISVPRVLQSAPRLMKVEAMVMADGAAAPAREALAGFHLYTLSTTVDLADGKSKQVALLSDQSLPANRVLISEGHPNVYGRNGAGDVPSHPAIQIEVTNDRVTGSGEPIPAGTLRLYGDDAGGRSQFLGEDRLEDLAVGETAKVSPGQAFDVTVRRKQTDFKRDVMGRNTFEAAYDIRVQNGGTTEETVKLVENLNGEWTIENASSTPDRDGNQAIWTLTVAAGGEQQVRYRVRVRR